MKIFDFLNKNQMDKYNKRVTRLYKNVFDSEEGQEVLSDLIVHNFMLESTEGDPLKEGSRKVVLRILALLNYDSKRLQSMTKKILDVNSKNDNDEDE